MSSLESLIAVVGEAPLIDSLDFTLTPASTSVVDRRQAVRAYPTSASTLSPTGTRTVRIRLGGDDFVDASSIRLVYTINETGQAHPLVPLSGPWGVWSQVYLRSNGVETDNIPYYGRFHQQYGFNQLSMLEQFGEAGICGMAGSGMATNQPTLGVIAAGGSYTVMHKMHLSLFSSGKLLPTRYMPLELECTIGAAADWLRTDGNRSSDFAISNIQLLYDSYTLDESVLESYYKSLLASRVLSIPVMQAYMVVQNIPGGSTSFDFAAVRAFSRLSHVWLTFRNGGVNGGPRSASFICPRTIPNNTGANPALSDAGPSARLSIGPKCYPETQPITTITEHFYHFQKAIPGVCNINRDNFQTNAFTICWDVRKVPSDPTSSISTRSGDLLRIELKNLTADVATECYLTLFAFGVVAIREAGVTVLN